MSLYIYAIIDSNDKMDETIHGLHNLPVFNIPYKDISLVVSNFDDDRKSLAKTQVLEHEDVLERLLERFTVLPFRFHTLYDRGEDACSMLEAFYDDFRKNLDRLRNKAEFGIKVLWAGDKITEEIARDYDRDRGPFTGDKSQGKLFIMQAYKRYKTEREFEERADNCIAVIDNFFSRFAFEKKLEKLKSKNLLLNAFYLVENERQKDFKEAFNVLRTSPGDFQYLLSGPWPPYNFIRIEYGKDRSLFS